MNAAEPAEPAPEIPQVLNPLIDLIPQERQVGHLHQLAAECQ